MYKRQAVAYAARQAKIECNIYVPEGSSKAKVSNMKNYGATINIFGSDCVEAEAKAREVSEKNQVPYVSPYNDFHIVAGQGTMGAEIKSQANELDAIIISLGGGGLMAGIASLFKICMAKYKSHWLFTI